MLQLQYFYQNMVGVQKYKLLQGYKMYVFTGHVTNTSQPLLSDQCGRAKFWLDNRILENRRGSSVLQPTTSHSTR